MSFDDRKLEVLRAIVEDYVATQEPVGSKALADRHQLGVSPATIRNDMAALEEERLFALAPRLATLYVGGGTIIGRTVLEGPTPGPTTFTAEAVDGSGNVSAQSNGLVLNVDHC